MNVFIVCSKYICTLILLKNEKQLLSLNKMFKLSIFMMPTIYRENQTALNNAVNLLRTTFSLSFFSATRHTAILRSLFKIPRWFWVHLQRVEMCQLYSYPKC